MFHLANTYFPTMFLIFVVIITLFIEESNFDTNVMVLTWAVYIGLDSCQKQWHFELSSNKDHSDV